VRREGLTGEVNTGQRITHSGSGMNSAVHLRRQRAKNQAIQNPPRSTQLRDFFKLLGPAHKTKAPAEVRPYYIQEKTPKARKGRGAKKK